MDYLATQEPAVLTYRKSYMVLATHSNASYLNEYVLPKEQELIPEY